MEAADVAPVLRHSMTHLHIQIVSVTTFSTRRARGTATNLVHEVTPLTDGAMLQRMFMASGWRLNGRVLMPSEAMCIVAGFGQDWHVILQNMVMVESKFCNEILPIRFNKF